jgi:hypothetical protein
MAPLPLTVSLAVPPGLPTAAASVMLELDPAVRKTVLYVRPLVTEIAPVFTISSAPAPVPVELEAPRDNAGVLLSMNTIAASLVVAESNGVVVLNLDVAPPPIPPPPVVNITLEPAIR